MTELTRQRRMIMGKWKLEPRLPQRTTMTTTTIWTSKKTILTMGTMISTALPPVLTMTTMTKKKLEKKLRDGMPRRSWKRITRRKQQLQ